jgi:uncharacterized protein (DUF433 family)
MLPVGVEGATVALMSFNYHAFFEQRGNVCGGEVVIKGTRVPLRTLLASLAEGASVDEILADFPTVSREAMRAVMAFAAASAGEDLPVPFAPATA